MQSWRARDSRTDKSIAMIYTKGCLHQGHFNIRKPTQITSITGILKGLVRQAKMECDFLVIIIFVNRLEFPTQQSFEDFPRRPQEDIQALQALGYVDVLFMPPASEFYRTDAETAEGVTLSAGSTLVSYQGGLADIYEVARRPEKFRALCTMLIKMMGIVQPSQVYVGRECIQTERLLRLVFGDLLMPVELVTVPMTRANDGVILDARLTLMVREELELTRLIFPALLKIIQHCLKGEYDVGRLLQKCKEQLERPGLIVDYLAIVDEGTFEAIERVDPTKGGLIIIGYTISGKFRLVDNVTIAPFRTKNKVPFFKRLFKS